MNSEIHQNNTTLDKIVKIIKHNDHQEVNNNSKSEMVQEQIIKISHALYNGKGKSYPISSYNIINQTFISLDYTTKPEIVQKAIVNSA